VPIRPGRRDDVAEVHAIDPPREQWVTRHELAAHWRISLKTLDALVREEGLPSEMWGRRMRRFNLVECEAWRRGRRAA
jgi:hypothetical protein